MVNLLGLHLRLFIGGTVPTPAPLKLNEALESVEVTHKDEGRSGFQLVFEIGRSVLDRKDYALLKETRLKPFNRVLLNVFFGFKPLSLMDGIITTHQLAPGSDPGTSKLTITGEDLSVMLDLEQKASPFPNLSEKQIVQVIVARELGKYGVLPDVTSAENAPVLTVDERTTTQDKKTTSLGFIKKLAGRFGYVFYIETGPAPGMNKAYWGPPNRLDLAQGALSVNMGPHTNIETISFKYNEMAPKRVDYDLAKNTPGGEIRTYSRPRLAKRIPEAKKLEFLTLPDGLKDREARRIRAQGELDKSFEQVVTATGTLNALRYGRILKPRGLVDVRGAGEHYSGSYYVKEVKHKIDVRKGEYKQTFTLTREGVGAKTLRVTP